MAVRVHVSAPGHMKCKDTPASQPSDGPTDRFEHTRLKTCKHSMRVFNLLWASFKILSCVFTTLFLSCEAVFRPKQAVWEDTTGRPSSVCELRLDTTQFIGTNNSSTEYLSSPSGVVFLCNTMKHRAT